MLKKWQKALIIVGCIILFWGCIAIWPRPQAVEGTNPLIVGEGNLPMLIAHRGGLAEFPENTLEAYYNAVSVDPNAVLEMDFSITKDDIPVLCHDLALDRTTNMTGLISDYTYEQLLAGADFGYANVKDDNGKYVLTKYKSQHPDFTGKEVTPIDVAYPSGKVARDETRFLVTRLEDILINFDNLMVVEVKQSGELGLRALKIAIDLLTEYDAFDRVILGSFHSEVYDKMKEYKRGDYPQLQFSPETGGVVGILVTSWVLVDAFYNEPIVCLQVPMEKAGINVATPHFVKTAHKHNLAVQYWTINSVEDMRIVIDIGADGIMTNYPHRLASVFEEYKNR